MAGFLLADDAISARKQQFDDWVGEQKRNAEQAAQQAQQAVQARVQQDAAAVQARAQEFQSWVAQQQQQRAVAEAPPSPQPPAAPAMSMASTLQPSTPPAVGVDQTEDPVTARAKQFSDWIAQQTQQATQPPAQPTAPTQQQGPPSLPPAEEPATRSDTVGPALAGKWKTQFDHGATYTGSYRTGTPHRGIDLVPNQGGIGTAVEAFQPGTVTNISRDSGAGGLMVYVQDDQGLTHAYMHLDGTAPGLQVGQKVGRGQRIATMGESGTEGSPHLHYEVRKNAATGDPLDQLIDPRPYIAGQEQKPGTTPPSRFNPTGKTTAELSGGGAAGGMTERAQSIMSEAGQAAAAFGGDAAKAVQSVLVTEGGLNNARGDSGSSAGPLQFFGEEGGRAGQLNNFARDIGVPLEDARKWIEQNPVAAVKWALGSPDSPGYLGRALLDGIQKGLSGADLATHIQRVGQVSVSPERAGANFLSLFGQGQEAIRGAGASAVESALEAGRRVEGRAGELVREGEQLVQQGQDKWAQLDQMQAQTRAESERWFNEQRARGEEWDTRRQRQDLDWQRGLNEQVSQFQENARGFTAPFVQGAQDLVQGGGRFFEGLGTDVRRQQAEAQTMNPYLAGAPGGGFSDPGTALTAGLERAGVPSPYREILGGGAPILLPSGAVRGATTTAAREAVELGASRPDLIRRVAELVTVEGPDAIRGLLNAPEVQQVLRSRAGPGVAQELAEAVPAVGRAAAAGGEEVLERVIGPGDVGRRIADIVTKGEPAQAGAMAAARLGGATLGGVTGWQTTPEEAGPVERIGRTLGGVGVGLAAPGIAEAAVMRPQIRQDMLESLRRGGLAVGQPPAAVKPGVNAATAVDVTKQLMLTDPVGRAMDMVGSVVELVRQPIALAMGGQGPEAGAGLAALTRALPEAFDNARQALQGQQVATLGQQAADIGKSKPIFRLLAAGDTFTRTLGEYQGMASRGVRMLRDAGIDLGTPQAEQYLAQHADELYREGAKSGTSSVFGSARQGQGASALDRLMTGFSNYKQTLLSSSSKVDQALGALLDQQIPFTGVPSRVLQIGLERVPGITQSVGAARIVRALQKNDTFAAQKALGEVATESLIQAHIAQAIRGGNITGPDDPEHPSSVRVNGEWVPLRTFGVYGLPMGIMAAFAESVEKTGQEPDPDQLERVAAALNASMEPLMDAVPGFSFVKMLAGLGRGGLTRSASDVASDFIGRYTTPAALAKAENMVDPYVRDIATRGFESLWEPSLARNPFTAQRFLDPKIDPTTGEPMRRGVTPLGGVDKPSSPVRAELARLKRMGYDLNPPTDKPSSITVRGVSVPVKDGSAEQRAMVAARGQFLAEAGQQMQTPRYSRMSNDQKARMWSSLINRSERVLTRAWRQSVEPERAARILATGKRVVGRVRDVEDEDELINRQVAIANQLRRQQMARTG